MSVGWIINIKENKIFIIIIGVDRGRMLVTQPPTISSLPPPKSLKYTSCIKSSPRLSTHMQRIHSNNKAFTPTHSPQIYNESSFCCFVPLFLRRCPFVSRFLGHSLSPNYGFCVHPNGMGAVANQPLHYIVSLCRYAARRCRHVLGADGL